jgi:hypothetical protein
MLPVWKEAENDLKTVHSKVLQYELYRMSPICQHLIRWRPDGARSASSGSKANAGSRPHLQPDWVPFIAEER